MTGDTSELAMMGLVLTILILVFGIVWFVFLLPMEKGLHRRRVELLQRRLQQNEERLRREAEQRARGQEKCGSQEEQPRRRASG